MKHFGYRKVAANIAVFMENNVQKNLLFMYLEQLVDIIFFIRYLMQLLYRATSLYQREGGKSH